MTAYIQRTDHAIFMESIAPICSAIIGVVFSTDLTFLFLRIYTWYSEEWVFIIKMFDDLLRVNKVLIIQRYSEGALASEALQNIHIVC